MPSNCTIKCAYVFVEKVFGEEVGVFQTAVFSGKGQKVKMVAAAVQLKTYFFDV